MPDFNQVLDPGDFENGHVNAIIDIPLGSSNKIEWDRERALFVLDRVEPRLFAKPVNYGFIPQTLDEDGDELDILCVTREPLVTGLHVPARILGVLNFEDDHEWDYKIVTVPDDDRDAGDAVQTLDDLGERWKQMITHHFEHYKDLKAGSSTVVHGWGDRDEAIGIVRESVERWKNR